MTARRHALDDALHALERADTLTRGALAQQLHITELDVDILMLTAETNRLVNRMAAGEWTITERGRRSLHPPDRGPSSRAPSE
jgi:hypothetical protein